MTQLLTPGQETYMNIRRQPTEDGQPGDLLFVVLISLFTDHVSVTFDRHDILDRALPVAEGRAYLQFLKDEAAAGTPMWLIIERAGAWTSAAAVVDDADQAMIDGILANIEAAAPRPVDVSDIVTGDGYQAEKRRARAEAARYATRTQVHRQEPTPAELARIRAHQDGIVTRAPGQSWTLLRAIVRRGLAVEHDTDGGIILSVRLNARGMTYTQPTTDLAA